LKKGDFTKNRLPIGWLIHTTCSWNLQSELKLTHENVPTALPRFKNVIFRHHYVMQKNSSCIETEKFSLQSSLLQPPKLNVDRST